MKSHLTQEEKDELKKSLISVAELAGSNIAGKVEVSDSGCPHGRPKLPEGKKAIYLFSYNKTFLKIGIAGVNSGSRFENQHYNSDSSNSNLAKSILNDGDMQKYELNKENVGDWILNNVHRANILIDGEVDDLTVKLLESFLHCKLKPKYEG